jgi:hypothetical protein
MGRQAAGFVDKSTAPGRLLVVGSHGGRPTDPDPDPVEVAGVFHVPLDWLADPTHLERSVRPAVAGGPDVPVYSYQPYHGHVLWGASARITLDLLGLLGLRP